jgi:DNA invertase Pin-like site-specific DNA recombinase
MSEPAQAIGYSYIRFSTPEQEKGDSLRRQAEATRGWCERNGVTLDTTLTFRDLGKSAYLGDHRTNPDRYALAAFLKMVEKGRIAPGSALIVESLDRQTREHIRPALTLLLNLIEAGVRVVQLIPAEVVYDKQVEPMNLMMAIMELGRGHSESAVKSNRIGQAWGKKKQRAREGGYVMTRRLPGWVEEANGKLKLLPGPAAAVRRIFRMATAGHGLASIVRTLTGEDVPTFGDTGRWVRSYVGKILNDRRVVGEFQPHKINGKTDGAPIPDYFPAVVGEDEFNAARAALASRNTVKTKRRRVRTRSGNLFTGLLACARDGCGYHLAPQYVRFRLKGGKVRRYVLPYLRNTSGAEGRMRSYTFPYDVFEWGVLSKLREIDPREILDGGERPDEAMALAGELAGVEGKIAALEVELLAGDVPSIARVLRGLEDRRRELAAKLSEARVRAASPAGEAWGECKTLIDALAKARDPEEARVRLRSALRRVVSGMWLLVVIHKGTRVCAVRVQFADSERHRDYLVYHRAARTGHPAVRQVRSFADAGLPAGCDLRKPRDAAALEKLLARALAKKDGAVK